MADKQGEGNIQDIPFETKVSMRITRGPTGVYGEPGSVEERETQWGEIPPEGQKKLLAMPSFREWLRAKGFGVNS